MYYLPKNHAADTMAPYKATTLCGLAAAFLLIGTSPATAALIDSTCLLAALFQSNFFRGIATLGVIAVGVGASMGKVTWTMAVTVAVGISIGASAGWVADQLNGTFTACTGVS